MTHRKLALFSLVATLFFCGIPVAQAADSEKPSASHGFAVAQLSGNPTYQDVGIWAGWHKPLEGRVGLYAFTAISAKDSWAEGYVGPVWYAGRGWMLSPTFGIETMGGDVLTRYAFTVAKAWPTGDFSAAIEANPRVLTGDKTAAFINISFFQGLARKGIFAFSAGARLTSFPGLGPQVAVTHMPSKTTAFVTWTPVNLLSLGDSYLKSGIVGVTASF
ncbi:MAG: hypothetical protein PHT12_02850 [Patescibacteria group bacterium]|nr:hypothetical protein [Patescibacteria group bacterium]